MNIDRRKFFKVLSAGVVAATNADRVLAGNTATYKRPKQAVGILYDATICIGCKVCEVGCKHANQLPPDHSLLDQKYGVSNIWDSAVDNSPKSYLKIKLYKNGNGIYQNRERNGFSFIRSACMHCVRPDCVSACPVSALTKDKTTGIVTWNPNACIGCRYCQVACPFEIPKFEFDKPFPRIQKCFFCFDRIKKGQIPACAEYCPTGATLYGKYSDILKEANHRLTLTAGQEYEYPVHTLNSGFKTLKRVAKYIDYIYGENDGGGTQYIILSAVPFEKLGLPQLPDYASSEKSESLQHTIYKGMIAPIALLIGLVYAAHRSLKNQSEDE